MTEPLLTGQSLEYRKHVSLSLRGSKPLNSHGLLQEGFITSRVELIEHIRWYSEKQMIFKLSKCSK